MNNKLPEKNDGLQEWESKLLDDENQPKFYDTLEVLSLKDNLNKVAKAVIIINIALWLFSPPIWHISIERSDILQIQPFTVLKMLYIGLKIAITYFPLKALAHILRILMEMEFNSRKAKV